MHNSSLAGTSAQGALFGNGYWQGPEGGENVLRTTHNLYKYVLELNQRLTGVEHGIGELCANQQRTNIYLLEQNNRNENQCKDMYSII